MRTARRLGPVNIRSAGKSIGASAGLQRLPMARAPPMFPPRGDLGLSRGRAAREQARRSVRKKGSDLLPLLASRAVPHGSRLRPTMRDRGLLHEGYRADVTIFDPVDFRDRATYADPHQYPTGHRTAVIVNDVIVVEDAAHTGALPGRVLRRDRDGQVG